MSSAIEYALARNHQVAVVSQPWFGTLRERHMDQQHELAGMLQRRFAKDRRVRYVNLGEVVDLADPHLSFDRMHLTPAGNARMAAALVAPVLQMAALKQVASNER
jgi:lysophospholipase L1-like esterase